MAANIQNITNRTAITITTWHTYFINFADLGSLRDIYKAIAASTGTGITFNKSKRPF